MSTASHQVKDLVEAIDAGVDPHQTFADGVVVQRVLDAVQRSSHNDAVWTSIDAHVSVAQNRRKRP